MADRIHQPSAISHQPPAISHRPSAISHQLSAISLVMLGILAGNITGFLREAVIAQHFGLSRWTDAYLIAYTLPEFAFTLLAVVVGGAVIPVFLAQQVNEGETRAWSLWRAFTLILGIILTIGAVVGIVTAPIYLRWMAPGFSPAELHTIVTLARPMLLAAVLIGLSVSVSAALNACRRFTLPSLATAAYNLAFVGAVIGAGAWLGPRVLGWAVLLGAAAHLGLQLPALRRQIARSIQRRPSTGQENAALEDEASILSSCERSEQRIEGCGSFPEDRNWHGPHPSIRCATQDAPVVTDERAPSGDANTQHAILPLSTAKGRITHHPFDDAQGVVSRLREIARLALPLAAGYTIHHTAIVVDRALASTLSPGSVAALNFGYRLPQVVGQMLGMAVATVAFPSLAERAAEGDLIGLRRILAGGLKLLLALGVVLLVMLVLLRVPLIRLLFQRGAFDAGATAMTAGLLVWYAPGVLADMLCQPLWRACYAFRDGFAVVAANGVQTATRVGLNLAFIPLLGARGIALSFSIGLIVQLGLLAFVIRRRLAAGVAMPEQRGIEIPR